MITRDIARLTPVIASRLHTELLAAGIPVESVASYLSQGFIRIHFLDTATQQQQTTGTDAVVAAHTGIDTDQWALDDIRARWLVSAIHGKDPTAIYTLLQTRINAWSSLAAAKTDLAEWIPLIAAALAWAVMKDEQR
jgi:hypothetical protein